MPDAKSLLPGRAFRSEHAQLRPEPHSIASHGPAPMDPLQTTRMRNGVLYAAEWPCCHDPLRLSLGSEDPFSQPTRSARAVAHPPLGGCAPAARAECVRLPRARGGVRPTPPPSLPLLSLLASARDAPSPPVQAKPRPPTPRASAVGPPLSSPQPLGCVLRATHPLDPNAGGRAAPASPLLLPTASVCASCPPPQLTTPRPHGIGKRVCHACPRRCSAPTESSGGLNARRSHPLHPPHQTAHHTSLEPPPPRTLMHFIPLPPAPSLPRAPSPSPSPPATRRLHAA